MQGLKIKNERIALMAELYVSGLFLTEIADVMGHCPATISRKLDRVYPGRVANPVTITLKSKV